MLATHVAAWSFGVGTVWVVCSFAAGLGGVTWPTALTVAWGIVLLLHAWSLLVQKVVLDALDRSMPNGRRESEARHDRQQGIGTVPLRPRLASPAQGRRS